jgi:hypothetical protein
MYAGTMAWVGIARDSFVFQPAFSVIEPFESCRANMSYEELGADQFVLHRKHKSRYKDEVPNAVQCITRCWLFEYIHTIGPELRAQCDSEVHVNTWYVQGVAGTLERRLSLR